MPNTPWGTPRLYPTKRQRIMARVSWVVIVLFCCWFVVISAPQRDIKLCFGAGGVLTRLCPREEGIFLLCFFYWRVFCFIGYCFIVFFYSSLLPLSSAVPTNSPSASEDLWSASRRFSIVFFSRAFSATSNAICASGVSVVKVGIVFLLYCFFAVLFFCAYCLFY